MKKETRAALLGSIKKWEKIVLGTGADNGEQNCPLCKLYINHACQGCPVAEKTGDVFCDGSPYEYFIVAYHEEKEKLLGGQWHWGLRDPHVVIGPKSQKAAIQEYNFLVGLLP
jgi:hypothetical protein